ncbi:hypothetical protein BCD67_24060 [Oscillatoriales cyanobacterium USR001]|nr:hypothetical protein BCD67_24060 [Oscillatoriales cyanobacterium USR001]
MSISEYSLENSIVQPETSSRNATQNVLPKNTELSSEVVNNFYTLAAQWESEVAGLSLTAQMQTTKSLGIVCYY